MSGVDLFVVTGRTLRLDCGANADLTGTEMQKCSVAWLRGARSLPPGSAIPGETSSRDSRLLTQGLRGAGGSLLSKGCSWGPGQWPVVRTADCTVPASVSPSDALAAERRKHVG